MEGEDRTVVVVTFIIGHTPRLDTNRVVITLGGIEGSTDNKASRDEGERDEGFQLGVGGLLPESVVILAGRYEFLFNRQAVARILEDLQKTKTPLHGGEAIEPLVMDSREATVAAPNLGNHEKLMTLTHRGLQS